MWLFLTSCGGWLAVANATFVALLTDLTLVIVQRIRRLIYGDIFTTVSYRSVTPRNLFDLENTGYKPVREATAGRSTAIGRSCRDLTTPILLLKAQQKANSYPSKEGRRY